MNEEWKDVVGYEEKYKVSSTGKVWSISHKKEMTLQSHLGYYSVILQKDKTMARKRVSRLVYEAFREPIPKGLQVDHIDRNRKNNNIENLRCVTALENQFNREARRTFPKNKGWGYATRIFGKLYLGSGFATEEEAYQACEKCRLTHARIK